MDVGQYVSGVWVDRFLVAAGGLGLLVIFVCGSFWPVALFGNFPLQGLAVYGIVTAGAACFRRWKLCSIYVVFVVLIVVFWLPVGPELFTVMGDEAEPSSESLPFVLFNSSTEPETTRRLLTKQYAKEAETVFVVESSPLFKKIYDQHSDRFPHQVHEYRWHNFGMSVVSAHPIDRVEVVRPPGPDIPWLQFDLRTPEKTLTVLMVHTIPPPDRERFRIRNRQLRFLKKRMRNDQLDVVLGDLNIAPGSSYFPPPGDIPVSGEKQGWTSRTDGNPFFVTWPAGSPLLYTALDHVFTRQSIQTSVRAQGDLGSDHYPIQGRFSW